MATLLIGYDVESYKPEITERFLKQAQKIHSKYKAPCTLFILGHTLELMKEIFYKVLDNPLFDLQQHTYSHLPLKTVCIDDGKQVKVVKGASLYQIEVEVKKTSRLLNEILGVKCIGLTGPWCYYRGLCDRPDILEILHRQDIRFTRTWARNERDYQPTPFEVQPFWYENLGFPEILECPGQGYQDVYWHNLYGDRGPKAYCEHLRQCIDTVIKNDWVYGYMAHDHSALRQSSDMNAIQSMIEYALSRDVKIKSYAQFYQEQLHHGKNLRLEF
jgi:hypothetical protein